MPRDRSCIQYALCCTHQFSKSGIIGAAIISLFFLFHSHAYFNRVYQSDRIVISREISNSTSNSKLEKLETSHKTQSSKLREYRHNPKSNHNRGSQSDSEKQTEDDIEEKQGQTVLMATARAEVTLKPVPEPVLNSVGNSNNDAQEIPKSWKTFPGCKKSSVKHSVGLDCGGLISNDSDAYDSMEEWAENLKPLFSNDLLTNNTSQQNCELFKKHFCFPTQPLSKEEADFPLGYVLMASEEAEQTLRFFNNIYWPQNLYCMTYDTEAGPAVKALVDSLEVCFDNVIVPSHHEEIHWGHHSVIQAAVNCLEAMHHHRSHGFKYAQIVNWSDMPLKTNLEMVKILKVFNGSQDSQVKSARIKRYRHPVTYLPYKTFPKWPPRFNEKWRIQGFGGRFYVDKKKKKDPPPGNVKIFGGSFAATISREFVDFLFTDRLPMKLLDWMKDTHIPDEQFLPTIIHNPEIGAPGSYPGFCNTRPIPNPKYLEWSSLDRKAKKKQKPPPKEMTQRKEWLSRYQIWMDYKINMKRCGAAGMRKWRHGSCVFGLSAMSDLVKVPHFVAHKFMLSYQPAAYFCLSDWLNAKTYGEESFVKTDYFNIDTYTKLPSVIYQNTQNLTEIKCEDKKR